MNETPHPSIRGYFAESLRSQMGKDPSIQLLCCDLGYGMFDRIKQEFPKQYYNLGASEQAAMGVAVGMAIEGLKPFIYSITPFLIYRAFETIRNYVDHEDIAVRLIGSGIEKDYAHDGFSHHSFDVPELLRNHLPNVCLYIPETKEEVPQIVKSLVEIDQPALCILRR